MPRVSPQFLGLGLGLGAKRKLKRQYGTLQVLFTSYFSEFLWRNKYGNLNVFGELINTIREFYVL